MSVRLYVLLARAARTAVVFRRGPSKQVLLLRWDLEKDRLQEGQWLKGRIYEQRCDLSPSGERLIYFAAKQKPPYFTWTAVSRPPWLTALALWPKGDSWGGGGLFAGEFHLLLNHRAGERQVKEGRVPGGVMVGEFSARGWGEDFPLESERRIRDGWKLEEPGAVQRSHARGWKIAPPRRWARRSPRGAADLRESVFEMATPNQAWERKTFTVSRGGAVRELGELDWADWDANGDLLFARDGRLFRLDRRSILAPDEASEVADLRNLRFTSRVAPEWARDW